MNPREVKAGMVVIVTYRTRDLTKVEKVNGTVLADRYPDYAIRLDVPESGVWRIPFSNIINIKESR